METRDGLVEFRTVKIGRKKVIEYRQCFKGIWTEWKPAQ